MTIHDMLKSAATDLTAMEIKMRTLESQVESVERDNERLRKAYAEAEVRRVNAETDLVHYQNLFVANVCKEAIDICKDMFEITHKNMRDRAEAAVQRMVEEKLEKEREESAAKPASDINQEDYIEQQEINPFPNNEFEDRKVQAASAPVPQDDKVVQAPAGLTPFRARAFYGRHIGFIPNNAEQRPVFYKVDGKWYEKGSFRDDGKPIPSFLSNPEPKTDNRGGVSRAVLAVFGG